jgi:uncharacterized protein (TIGR02145 family)/uncharacterized repeat protein (TIGR02543 family)
MGEAATYNNAAWNGNNYQHKGVCPEGWRLPNKEDWDALAEVGKDKVFGRDTSGTVLKGGSGNWATGIYNNYGYGFVAEPGGYYNGSSFIGAKTRGDWWTATQINNSNAYEYIITTEDGSTSAFASKAQRGASVRCVAYTQEKYAVDVKKYEGTADATGGGDYAPGETVTVSAGTKPEGKGFNMWQSQNIGVVFDDVLNSKTTFIMQGENVTVTAAYQGGFKDERDGKSYSTVTIGDRMWMAENLNYETESGSMCYMEEDGNCDKYGRLYEYKNALSSADGVYKAENLQGICPDGWHVPNANEWNALNNAVGGAQAAVMALRATSGWSGNGGNGPDAVGFRSLPGGWYNSNNKTFEQVGTNAQYISNTLQNATNGNNRWASMRCVAYLQQTYAVTVNSEAEDATGGGDYEPGATVTITTGTIPDKKRFSGWTVVSGGVTLASTTSPTTTFIMPGNDVTVRANFPQIYFDAVVEGGEGATGGGVYMSGDSVAITAGTHPDGLPFEKWTVSTSGVFFKDNKSETTKFKMPSANVTVTAVFGWSRNKVEIAGGGAGAAGDGEYTRGETVTITAGTHSEGLPFLRWISQNKDAVLENRYDATTTFTMPDSAVTVTAFFGASVTDIRDGQKYRIVGIGGKRWMAENLNYETTAEIGGSKCYGNNPQNCDTYGKLYTWAAAMDLDAYYNNEKWGGSDFKHRGSCPYGWHLPDTAEWGALVRTAGGPSMAHITLGAKSGWYSRNPTDDFGFSALPGGYDNNGQGSFGYWQMATEYDQKNAYRVTLGSMNGKGEIIYYESKGTQSSIRCVSDRVPITKITVTDTSLTYTGTLQSPGIPESPNGEYNITGNTEKDAGHYIATVALTADYMWSDGTTQDLKFTWSIARAEGVFPDLELDTLYSPTLRLSDLALPDGYAWSDALDPSATRLSAGVGQKFAAVFTDPDSNHAAVSGEITVNVAKGSGLAATPPAVLEIRNDDRASHVFDLSAIDLRPTDHGELSYSLGEETDGGPDGKILQSAPTLTGGKSLEYQGSGKSSGAASQVIVIRSENYDDITVTVAFEATAQPVYAVTVVGGQAERSAYPEGGTVVVTAYEAEPGKVFEKWTTSDGVEFGDSVATPAAFTMPARAVAVAAVFKDISYTITFNADSGEVSPAFGATGAGGKLASLPTPVRIGYVFDGWFTAEEGGSRVDTSTAFSASAEIYARWTLGVYAVAWDADGGAPEPKQRSVTYLDSIAFPDTMGKIGYTFKGWYADSAFTEAAQFPMKNVASDTAFYAKWAVATYGVTWYTNGGTPLLPMLSVVNHGGSVAAPPTEAAKAGHVLEGWFRDSALTAPAPLPITAVTADLTLYAKWLPVYTVTFNPNGGSVDTAYRVTGTNGRLASLSTPVRSGYMFDAWYTERTGGDKITATTVFRANDTVYARWTVAVYLVSFDVSGCNFIPPASTSPVDGKLSSLPTPTCGDTRTFDGWYTARMGSGDKVTTSRVYTENTVIYVNWIQHYKVTFNPNGGMVSIDYDITGPDGKLASLPTPTAPPVGGYAFDGWYSSGGVKITTNYVFRGDATVVAEWSPIDVSYTVTFNANGGTVSPAFRTTTGDGTLTSLPTPAREGFRFIGWYTTASSSSGVEVTAGTVFEANATVFARWTPVYTVTFNPNGGSVSPTSAVIDLDGMAASWPTPTRAGYKFDGWFTTASGGTEVAADNVFTANTAVYAHWTLMTYTITFNPNGGAVSVTSGATGAGGKLASLPTPVWGTYTFVGWFTEVEGGTRVTANTVFDDNITVYAQWSRLTHAKVTFSAGLNGTLTATVDGIPIAPGDSVGIGKDVVFTALPGDGYKVVRWTINGTAVVDTSYTYVIAGVSNAATIYVSFEPRISVASPGREIPGGAVGGEVVAIAPVKVLSGLLALGPNPVRVGGDVAIYWTG